MKTLLYFLVLIMGLPLCNILGQSKPIGEIPFTINEDGLMLIELRIHKEKISKFVLDTGASTTVLDDDVATRLDLKLIETQSISTGANGISKNRKKTDGQKISITEKVALKDIKISVVDLSHLGEINGIIGFDLFRNFVSAIDFDNKKITFFKRKGKPNTEGYQAVDFVESYCTPEVEVSFSLEDGATFNGKVFFDTGNTASPLSINSSYKVEHNLPTKFETLITAESKGINAKSEINQGRIKSLKLGAFELGEMPVSLSNAKQGVLSWKGYMGLMGLEYISKFNFIIDYHRKKIYLKPNNSFSNPFNFPLKLFKNSKSS